MKVFITRQLQPDTKQTIRELKEQIEQQRHCQFKLAPDFAEQRFFTSLIHMTFF